MLIAELRPPSDAALGANRRPLRDLRFHREYGWRCRSAQRYRRPRLRKAGLDAELRLRCVFARFVGIDRVEGAGGRYTALDKAADQRRMPCCCRR